MEDRRAWQIIETNLDKLVAVMLTVQKGASIDVFTDPTGANLAVSQPSGTANIKLCSVTAPDLEGSYGVHPSGTGFVNDDGEEIPRDQLAAYLVQYILGAKDGGAEWGWEFKPSA
ncbi:MAG: hypothetical protein ABSA72_01745 [Nitrososphaerales archaeon]|jgi:hypothetical protein